MYFFLYDLVVGAIASQSLDKNQSFHSRADHLIKCDSSASIQSLSSKTVILWTILLPLQTLSISANAKLAVCSFGKCSIKSWEKTASNVLSSNGRSSACAKMPCELKLYLDSLCHNHILWILLKLQLPYRAFYQVENLKSNYGAKDNINSVSCLYIYATTVW